MTTNHNKFDNFYKNLVVDKEFMDYFKPVAQAQLNETVYRAKLIQDNYHLIPAELRAGADSFMKKTEDLYVKHNLAVLTKKIGEPQYPTAKLATFFHNDLGKDFALRVLDRCSEILVALGFKVQIKHDVHFSELSIVGQENSTKSR